MMKLTLALLLLGVEGQYRSRRNRVVDGNAQAPRGFPRRLQNSSNGTGNGTGNATGNDTGNATVPATTTAAPTVQATTPAPTTVAATSAPTTVSATAAPTTVAATAAPTTAAPTTAAGVVATQASVTTTAAATTAAAGNGTNVTAIPSASVSTTVSMTVKLDLADLTAGLTEEAATERKQSMGNAFAFGIHASTCKGVASMWNTLGQCMMGIGKVEGVTFGMAMAIDTKLVGTQPGCNSAANCYGDVTPAPAARQLAAEDIVNSGDFMVTATGADVIAQAQTAQASLSAAESSGSFSAGNIAAEVATAIARPSMNGTLGDIAAGLVKAAEEAVVVATVSVVTGATPAPSSSTTSDAYTAGVTGVFALVFGALLF